MSTSALPSRTTPRRRSMGRRVTPERLSRILDVAVEIIVEEGFSAVTMQTVARRADYIRPVVYDCYGTPENIMIAAVDREAAKLAADIDQLRRKAHSKARNRHDHLAQVMLQLIEAVRSNPLSWLLFGVSVQGAPDHVVRTVNEIQQSIRAVFVAALKRSTSGLVHPPSDTEALAFLLHGIIETFIRGVIDDPEAYPPERMSKFVASVARSIRVAS